MNPDPLDHEILSKRLHHWRILAAFAALLYALVYLVVPHMEIGQPVRWISTNADGTASWGRLLYRHLSDPITLDRLRSNMHFVGMIAYGTLPSLITFAISMIYLFSRKDDWLITRGHRLLTVCFALHLSIKLLNQVDYFFILSLLPAPEVLQRLQSTGYTAVVFFAILHFLLLFAWSYFLFCSLRSGVGGPVSARWLAIAFYVYGGLLNFLLGIIGLILLLPPDSSVKEELYRIPINRPVLFLLLSILLVSITKEAMILSGQSWGRTIRSLLFGQFKPMEGIYCLRCNYLLRGLSQPRCPECGTEFKPDVRLAAER